MTFSIVAWNARAGSEPEWAVAVASKFLGVGSVVPYAAAGSGAVASQAFANLSFGPRGLERLGAGESAADVVAGLLADDERASERQIGVVDARGAAAAFTGEECFDWAGDLQGDGFTCQGNILAGPRVLEDMSAAFTGAQGPLADRLVVALSAGDAAGGDRRGRQSAALLVARRGAGYGGLSDVAVDLRVDDHHSPVAELARLLELHHLYFPRPEDLSFVPLDPTLTAEIEELLRACGYDSAGAEQRDAAVRDALYAFVGTENLEERWTDDAAIEVQVLEHLRRKARPRGET